MQVHDFNSFQNFLRENDVFSRFGISRIGVFGSFARGEKNYHDIDLLVDDSNPDFHKMIELKNYLEEKLQRRVDIVLKKYGDPIILFRAAKDLKYATVN